MIVVISSILIVCPVIENNKLLVGYSTINISPVIDSEVLSVPLGGYANSRYAEKIESDIYASCTAFMDADGNKALIYSIDILGIDEELVQPLLETISVETSVLKSSIILNCMHNHSAPEIGSTIEESKIYKEFLIARLVEVGKQALNDMSKCTDLYTGNMMIPDFSYNRTHDKEKRIDPNVPVAKFVRDDKKDLLLINWAAHCDTVSSKEPNAVSSDYVGVLRNVLSEKNGIDVSIQMGACGDINPACYFEEEHKYLGKDEYGNALAEIISQQINNLEKTRIDSKVDSISRTIGGEINHKKDDLYDEAIEIRDLYYAGKIEEYELKCLEYGIKDVYEAAIIRARYREDKYEDITVNAIQVGNIVFVSAPYEMFSYTGMKIKEASKFKVTFVMGYSNGIKSYIPAAYAFEYDDYEVYSCKYVRGTAEVIQNALIRMVHELKDKDLCRHNFVSMAKDETNHLLKCILCGYKITNPTKHNLDETGYCLECQEHIHKITSYYGFSGLSIACLGDSITLGFEIETSYVNEVKNILGLKNAYNYGMSWSTIGYKENCECNHPHLPEDYDHHPMVHRYNQMEKADIIFVFGGINDFGVNLPLGKIDDLKEDTFYGALNLLISNLSTTYPEAYIFMSTCFNYFDGYTNKLGDTWEEYNQAIRDVCKLHNIDCLDLYNSEFDRLKDTTDLIHPNQEYTTNTLAPLIANFIKDNYPKEFYYKFCERCDMKEKVEYENLFVDMKNNYGKICTYDIETKKFIEKITNLTSHSYTTIDVTNIKELRVSFTKEKPSYDWSYFFYDENDQYIIGGNYPVGQVDIYIKVPSNAKYIGLLYNPAYQYCVYQAD